jgi:hypothetical protein
VPSWATLERGSSACAAEKRTAAMARAHVLVPGWTCAAAGIVLEVMIVFLLFFFPGESETLPTDLHGQILLIECCLCTGTKKCDLTHKTSTGCTTFIFK